MDFKRRVISKLQIEGGFCAMASEYFKEPVTYIEKAVDLITDATLMALNSQFETLGKTDELFKIGKECAGLQINNLLGIDLGIAQKGRGINSEIFGVKLVHTIDDIAQKANVRNKTINFLMASTTPIILSLFHSFSEENKLSPNDIFNQLPTSKPYKKKAASYFENLSNYMKSFVTKK